MWDEIIEWTGWVIAIGMVVWRIFDVVHNRPKIKLSISENTEGFIITATNTGRHPVSIISAGLKYSDRTKNDFPSYVNFYKGRLHHNQPKSNHLSMEDIRESISRADNKVGAKFIYYSDESGNTYKVKIPKYIRDEFYK